MFELLNHPDETTRHNILCLLIKIMEEKDPGEFVSVARSSNMTADLQKEVIDKFQEHIKQKKAGEYSSFSMPLYVYIPNLREY